MNLSPVLTSRSVRVLLAAIASCAWLYAAFLTDWICVHFGLEPTLTNRGWIALALRSGFGLAALIVVLVGFLAAMSLRKTGGLPELALWTLLMLGSAIQFDKMTPRFANEGTVVTLA